MFLLVGKLVIGWDFAVGDEQINEKSENSQKGDCEERGQRPGDKGRPLRGPVIAQNLSGAAESGLLIHGRPRLRLRVASGWDGSGGDYVGGARTPVMVANR